MELATIEVDPTEARKAFLDYRRAVRAHRSAEDEQIMRAYREAAKGVRLLQLGPALAAGGTAEIEVRTRRWDSERGREVVHTQTRLVPRLAVARADVEKIWTGGIDRDGGCTLRYQQQHIGDRETRKRHRIPDGTFPIGERTTWGPTLVAMAPNIPPALRPTHHLRNYHLLWEAEWAQEPIPPGDPALLKHIGGDLYAVLAVWDLTPLEQAVLAGTRA